jgi:excisionase family DNA binding protein
MTTAVAPTHAEQLWLRPKQAAAYAAISLDTLFRWSIAGGPRAYRRGRVTWFSKLEIDEFILTGASPAEGAP